MNNLLFTFFLLLIGFSGSTQSTSALFIGLGIGGGTFQDTKYSDVTYAGAGGAFQLGWDKKDKEIYGAKLNISFGIQAPNTHDNSTVTVINPNLSAYFLKRFNDQLYLGGHWDIFDLYIRNQSGLGNNSTYYLSSSNLYLSGIYFHQKFNFGLDIGVLNYVKEGVGFAFSAPQNGQEDGEFGYQNDQLENPFGFKYFEWRSFDKHLNIRTKIEYTINERISLAYQWHMKRFSEVRNFPVTYGNHLVVMRLNISQKEKAAEDLN